MCLILKTYPDNIKNVMFHPAVAFLPGSIDISDVFFFVVVGVDVSGYVYLYFYLLF